MLKRVHPGDPISLSSNAYNAWCDAVDDLRQRQMATSASQRPETRDVDIVLVRNNSGVDVDQHGVLGIGGPLISPTENLDEFKRQVVISGVMPADGHTDAFVVLLEPLPSGAVGQAIISGVCAVQVDVANASDTICGADVDDTAKLKSGVGSNQMLWKESGTGTKWAIVRIGVIGGGSIQFAKLNADLDQGDSCEASIWSGDPLADSGDDVTVYDWFLESDMKLESGVKVMLTPISGKLYVTQSDTCPVDQ